VAQVVRFAGGEGNSYFETDKSANSGHRRQLITAMLLPLISRAMFGNVKERTTMSILLTTDYTS